MNIGFDAKRYFHNATGLGNYSRDLVGIIQDYFPDNRYFLFDKNPTTIELPFHTIAVVPSGNSILWRAYGILEDIKRYKIDVFHGLSNELPWGKWPAGVRKIVTIHDVIFKYFPEHYSFIDRNIYHRKTLNAVKSADIIIATSNATASDLLKFYDVNPEKIKVVYQTCGPKHWMTYSADELNRFRVKMKIPVDFLLYVSSFKERKNHISLLKAFKKIVKSGLNLVLAGAPGETLNYCRKFIADNNLGNNILLINSIDNSELAILYRCAQSFIYPSLMEGFGIPLLEAACAGLPMAVNDIEVFKEISPPGTLFFNSDSEESISKTILELCGREKTVNASFLERYKPETMAKNIYSLYE